MSVPFNAHVGDLSNVLSYRNCRHFTAIFDLDLKSSAFKKFVLELDSSSIKVHAPECHVQFIGCRIEGEMPELLRMLIEKCRKPEITILFDFRKCVISKVDNLRLFQDLRIGFIVADLNPPTYLLDILSSLGNGRIDKLVLACEDLLSAEELQQVCRLLSVCYIDSIVFNSASEEARVDQTVQILKTVGVKESECPYAEISSLPIDPKSAMKSTIKHNL